MKQPERRNVKRRRTTVSGDDPAPGGIEGAERPTSDSCYQIQEILGSRTVNGKEEFHVKWKGFGMADCTWEPKENIHAPDILAKFKQQGEGGKRKRRNVASEPAAKSKRELRSRKSGGASPNAVQETVAVEDSESSAAGSPPQPVENVERSTDANARDGSASSPRSSNVISVPVSAETTEASTEEPNTCVTISSSEIVSSSWISPEETPASPGPAETRSTVEVNPGLISTQDGEPFDENRWKVEHLGPPPCKGVAGHWALVVRDDGVQEYIPIKTVRRYFPNRLFDYLLARIQFRKEDN